MNTETRVQTWTRLFAFYRAQILLENVYIQEFSLYSNGERVGKIVFFKLEMATGLGERKLWI